MDFFLKGSWRASLFGATGFLVNPQGELIFPSAFPGMDVGQAFQQVPDLTFSVWLLNRYFLEASVIGDFLERDYDYFDQNYILMGYQGREEDFLKRILIGNRDVGIDPYPFIAVPAPGRSSLGAQAVLGTGISDHQLLLRYDNNESDSLTFIGRNLVTEQVIALDGYIRGRFFKLPDSNVTNLVVYIEDPAGTLSAEGKIYREATVNDAVLDSENGTVRLKQPAAGNVAVYYKKGVLEVGDISLGRNALPAENGNQLDLSGTSDFDWGKIFLGQPMFDVVDSPVDRRVVVNGTTALLLFRPGEFSPFEILASYLLETAVPADLSRLQVSLIQKGNFNAKISPEESDLGFRFAPAADHVEAYYWPAPSLRDSFRNLYPFLDDTEASPLFDLDNRLYGPAADPSPGYLRHELLVSWLTPVSEYRLPTDVVPGSVQILRNGMAETRYEVDYEGGAITFLTEIAPDDRITVSYRRKMSLAGNGDLLFAWGNTLTFSEQLRLQLATGVRWNFLPGSFTEEAYSRTGSVIVSAGLEGKAGALKYKASLGGAYTNPDTTGIMRLLGMESTGLDLYLSEDTAYPACPPADDGPLAPTTVNKTNRGKLYYKDYRSYGILGTSVLMPYTWTVPAEQVFPYATNSKPGPYVAAGSSGGSGSGQSLILDFDLPANLAGSWVGAQLPVLADRALADLSNLKGVSISYRAVDVTAGSFDIFLQIGEIGEDIDDDDALDRELSEAARGYTFNDPANLADLRVGSGPKNEGNGRLDTEDIDGDGFLDDEDAFSSQNIVTRKITESGPISADTGWSTYTYSFTAADKEKLRRSRAVRIVVTAPVSTAASARVLIDRITLAGSRVFAGWYTYPPPVITPADEVIAREIEEWEADNAPAVDLESAHPKVADVFHPFGETQKVLEVSWQNGGGQNWKAKTYIEALSEGIEYRNIVYYYHFPSADGSLLSFSLEDASGNGIRWSFPPVQTTGWSEIRVSIEEGKVYRDSSEIPGSSVSSDPGYGSLAVFSAAVFSVELTNATTATPKVLYLDELHLSDPRSALGAAATLDLELSLPGTLLSWGNHPLIHDLSFRESASFASRGFSTLYGTPAAANSFSSVSELDFGLSLADVGIDFTVATADSRVTLGGGHGVTFPNVSFPVVFTDSFSLRERESGAEIRRQNTLAVRFLPLFKLELDSQAGSLEEILTQSWSAGLTVVPSPFTFRSSITVSGAVTGFTLPPEGYLATWIRLYTLLAPWLGGTDLERKAAVDLDWSLGTRPLGLDTRWSYGFHSYDLSAPQRRLAGDLGLELSLPLVFRSGEVPVLTLRPGYRRQLGTLSLVSGSGGYGEDFCESFSTLFSQEYVYGQAPFAELFSSASESSFLAATAGLEEADYSAEAFLQLSRRFSSRLRDLFLPSLLELALEKRFLKDGDLTEFTNTYRLKSQSSAVNLFGSFGAYPLFPFYKTDEFSTSLRLALTTGAAGAETAQLYLDSYLSFEGEKGGALTFENRFGIDFDGAVVWSDAVKLLYAWYRYPDNGVRLPLVSREIEERGYWYHLESLEMKLSGPSEDTSYHPFNLIVSHESSVMLPDHGRLTAEISAGLDFERTEAHELYWRVGLRGGIEMRIEF